MKPVFKCDYCSQIGTEDEIIEHEDKCPENYDKRGCYTCVARGKLTMEDGKVKYACEKGKDIPAGQIFNFCDLYERNMKEKSPYSELTRNLFGGFF